MDCCISYVNNHEQWLSEVLNIETSDVTKFFIAAEINPIFLVI